MCISGSLPYEYADYQLVNEIFLILIPTRLPKYQTVHIGSFIPTTRIRHRSSALLQLSASKIQALEKGGERGILAFFFTRFTGVVSVSCSC